MGLWVGLTFPISASLGGWEPRIETGLEIKRVEMSGKSGNVTDIRPGKDSESTVLMGPG